MEILLRKDELIDLGNLRDLTLHCRSGRCWLTQAGDPRDHILRAGGSVRLRSSGRVLVTASRDCRLQLLGEPARAEQRLRSVALCNQ